jgi:eukaryotic-like serine/threonine-protein kinase
MPLEKLGPYKLDKTIGRGGMGAVYAGLNEATGARAAVKVLSGHLADDESFRERFKIEVETLKRLLHPNIVQLFGYGEEDGHLFYVMELVEGRSLQEELAAGRRFTWREVARIGIAVAQALKHAHDRGIIHRDLKPANLLIDAQDHVKLADFGIAKLYGGTNVTVDGECWERPTTWPRSRPRGSKSPAAATCTLWGACCMPCSPDGRRLAVGPSYGSLRRCATNSRCRSAAWPPIRRRPSKTSSSNCCRKDPQKRIPTALALSNRLKAMEHALSLETQVGVPLEQQVADLNLAPLDELATRDRTPWVDARTRRR